jgi:hypothetical protein
MTITRREFLKSTAVLGTATAITSMQVEGLFKTLTPTEAQMDDDGQLLTSSHDGGPFHALVKNGRWVSSHPLEPNLMVGHSCYSVKNRTYAPD